MICTDNVRNALYRLALRIGLGPVLVGQSDLVGLAGGCYLP